MTTLVPFVPPPTAPFQFTATLDGQQYTAIVTWNAFGARWYLNLYTLANQLILCRALTSGSPGGAGTNMVEGYFSASTLVYRESSNTFEISP